MPNEEFSSHEWLLHLMEGAASMRAPFSRGENANKRSLGMYQNPLARDLIGIQKQLQAVQTRIRAAFGFYADPQERSPEKEEFLRQWAEKLQEMQNVINGQIEEEFAKKTHPMNDPDFVLLEVQVRARGLLELFNEDVLSTLPPDIRQAMEASYTLNEGDI